MGRYDHRFDWQEAIALYQAGESGTALAVRYGVTGKAIYDCLERFGIERRSRATNRRPDELRCGSCRDWLPDSAFPLNRSKRYRRGRHTLCRPCNTNAKREWRERQAAA